jgi:hypothetical protein
MRSLVALTLATVLSATTQLHVQAMQANVVPLDNVTWNSDSAEPTTVGIARRAQIYYLLDFSTEEGRKMYKEARDSARSNSLENNFGLLHFLLAPGGSIEQRKAEDEAEYWVKGVPQNNTGLVRAFAGGDAIATQVIIDATGRVKDITRISGSSLKQKKDDKSFSELTKGANPIVEDYSLFPLSCKESLAWLRLGDLNRAMKDVVKAQQDAPKFIKLVTDRANVLIEMDIKVLTDLTTKPGDRLIAYNRIQGLMVDIPSAPAVKNAKEALKKTKEDKPLMTEIAAFGALMEYINVMKKTPAKKAIETQTAWLGNITAKFAGSYAAEVASKIKKCSKIP